MLRPGIGYVRVASFDPQTAKLLKDAIESLGGVKLKGLVLDLRNNAGGVVPAALECASYFLKPRPADTHRARPIAEGAARKRRSRRMRSRMSFRWPCW